MNNLTIYDFLDVKSNEQIWEEYHSKLNQYTKGISGGCYLCPAYSLCKDHSTGNREYKQGNKDKHYEIMEYYLKDFDRLYQKWKLDKLHKMIKHSRRELWQMYNNYEQHRPILVDDIEWSKHWLESLEQIEKEQRWTWTLEEEWTDYRKWKKKNYGSVYANLHTDTNISTR